MTATTIADPFAVSHEDIAEQLDPFCDGALDRFSDDELLYAYDIATAWAHDLLTAETAACSTAAEWLPATAATSRASAPTPPSPSSPSSPRSSTAASGSWTPSSRRLAAHTGPSPPIPNPHLIMPTTEAPTTTAPKKLPHKVYTVRGQKRALVTLGAGENCRLMDVPAALLDIAASGQPTPDSYLVEEGLRPRLHAEEINALLEDYLDVAERHQAIPMTVFAMTKALDDAYAA